MPIEKRWVIKPQGDPQKVDELATAAGIPKVLANLLVQRGIDTCDEVSRFFGPKLSDLHDPFLMKDMEKAVRRVDEALTRGEKIMVYGDYDVDGTTAVALVYIFLRQMGLEELLFYIPDRYTEGYGISKLGVDYAKKNGVDLIIALDCGIKAVEKVAYANQLGIDFIICDHHLPGEEIPAAVAVLDPKQPGDDYPFDELSGCGVGFKLVQGYCQYKDIPFDTIAGLLDLVVVSTAADIVPLVGENRILAHYGLKKLNEKPRKGLQSIIKSAVWKAIRSRSTTSYSRSAPASTRPAAWRWTGRRTCRPPREDMPPSTCSWNATKTSPTSSASSSTAATRPVRASTAR